MLSGRLVLLATLLIESAVGIDQCDRSIFNGRTGSKIPDEAFSASSFVYSEEYNTDFGPVYARYGMEQKGTSHRIWRASTLDTNQYIQVNLGAPFLVQGVATQGCGLGFGDCDEYVTHYRLQYSMDGEDWRTVMDTKEQNKTFNGNTDSTGLVPNFMDCPIIAQYVRINPLQWHNHISTAFDLFGCPTKKGANQEPVDPGLVLTEPIGGDTANVNPFRGLLHRTPTDGSQEHIGGRAKHAKSLSIATNKRPLTGPECLGGLGSLSCLGKQDGDYQHCVTCTKFIRCTKGHLSEFVCSSDSVWDDNVKDCMQKSTTCN